MTIQRWTRLLAAYGILILIATWISLWREHFVAYRIIDRAPAYLLRYHLNRVYREGLYLTESIVDARYPYNPVILKETDEADYFVPIDVPDGGTLRFLRIRLHGIAYIRCHGTMTLSGGEVIAMSDSYAPVIISFREK